MFDAADVLVLDSDLTPDHDAHVDDEVRTHLTSEMGGEVAHLVRGYTTAGAIMVVNERTQQRTFDLTLMGRAMAVADVYVSEDDIANAHLWGAGDAAEDAFHPSGWPRLDLLPAAISSGVDKSQLDAPWVAVLDLEDADWTSLHSGQLESLGLPEVGEIYSMTFRDLAAHPALGLRRKETTSPELLARVASCALRRWIDRVLLPSQNVVVDLPHLMQSHPWLVDGRDDVDAWNAVRGRWWGEDPPLAQEAFHGRVSELLGRNVWLTSHLEPRPLARVQPGDPVFCEDISQFRQLQNVRDFVSDVEGPSARRFVVDLEDVEYMPRNRLAV
ncbi:MAG: hypothetical protein R2715_18660 [Ilumatobacteraceae bacterium]